MNLKGGLAHEILATGIVSLKRFVLPGARGEIKHFRQTAIAWAGTIELPLCQKKPG